METPSNDLGDPHLPEVRDNLRPYAPLIALGNLSEKELVALAAQEAEDDPEA